MSALSLVAICRRRNTVIQRQVAGKQSSDKSEHSKFFFYSFSEKDSPLGTPASCRQLLEPQPIDAGKMPALPGNIYLKCYKM
ncbi:MAG TPA: hypothetical protein PLL06_03795 [Acidobacteriota bacterium]|nr:hypothetical protein [Acidobacteriota bacterium]